MKEKQLLFEESFDYQGKPNESIWTIEVGDRWHNDEKQCYTDQKENVMVKDGALQLQATLNDSPCKYLSGRINTKNKVHFMYGRFVIRAKLPKGRGSWPAIWFLGEDIKEVGWPKCGEIDLMEYAGNQPRQATCAIHTQSFNHRIQTDLGGKIELPDLSDTFHDFILEWHPNYLSFQVDYEEIFHLEKKETDTPNEYPFNKPYYLIINQAVGGMYGKEIIDTDLPFLFEVASIKVFSIDGYGKIINFNEK
jgi:beta-glucanase (GH16 family)